MLLEEGIDGVVSRCKLTPGVNLIKTFFLGTKALKCFYREALFSHSYSDVLDQPEKFARDKDFIVLSTKKETFITFTLGVIKPGVVDTDYPDK